MVTTATVQALIDSSVNTVIDITETILVSDMSSLQLRDKTLRLFGAPGIQINGRHWTIAGGKLHAQTGDLFECVNSSMGLVLNVWCSGVKLSKSLWKCVGSNQCYDTHVIGGEWSKPSSMTTPIVLVSVDGPFYNNNSWSKMRFQTNGTPQAPCVSIGCTHTTNWIYGNAFQDVNFEIPNGGAIELNSCFATTMRGVQIFDADLYGNITRSLVVCGRASSKHLRSNLTVIEQYFRLSGVRDPGVYDIEADSNQHMPYTFDIRSVGGIAGAKVEAKLSPQIAEMHPQLGINYVVV